MKAAVMNVAVMNAPVSDNLTLVINLGSSSLKAALMNPVDSLKSE